jgi:hypothetical protein
MLISFLSPDAFKGDRGADLNPVSGYADGKQRTALK